MKLVECRVTGQTLFVQVRGFTLLALLVATMTSLSVVHGVAQTNATVQGITQTNAATGVASLRSALANAWQRYDAEDAAANVSLQEQYWRELTTLSGSLQKSGDLDGLLAVKDEIDRFTIDRRLPAAASNALPPALKSLQTRCADAAARLVVEQNRKRVRLLGDYLKRLNSMQRSLTVAGKLPEALEVKAEIERVNALPEMVGPDVPASKQVETGQVGGSQVLSVLRRGLVLHYTFDRNEGRRVTDQSGKGNHGIVENAIWVARGKTGALRLENERSCVRVANRPSLNTQQNLSVFAWIKANPLNGFNQAGMIVHKFFSDTSNPAAPVTNGSGWLMQIHSTGNAGALSCCVWNKAAGAARDGTTLVADGDWHFVGIVYSGGEDAKLRLYVDGAQDGIGPQGGGLPFSIRNNDQDLFIGHYTFDTLHPPFRGEIDDLRIYNRSLTADEVRQLHEVTAPHD